MLYPGLHLAKSLGQIQPLSICYKAGAQASSCIFHITLWVERRGRGGQWRWPAPEGLQSGLAVEASWRMGGSSWTHRDSPLSPGCRSSQSHLHHRVKETAKTSDMNPNMNSRRAGIILVFPWEGPSCSFASISSSVLMHPLLLVVFSLLTRDTKWDQLYRASP